MDNDLKFHALKMMEKFGGGFASALSIAWQRADVNNQYRLEQAFPDLLAQYAAFPRVSS